MIIIAYKPGQLANRLFLFAKFLAYASKHRVFLINPSFDDYALYFKTTSRQFVPASKGATGYASIIFIKIIYSITFFCSRLLHKFQINLSFLNVTYLDWDDRYDLDTDTKLCRSGIHFIQGWEFQAQRLLNDYQKSIRLFFQPNDTLDQQIESFYNGLKNQGHLVGVHIRHGDYEQFMNGKYFYETEDYKNLMKCFCNEHPNATFLISTNNRTISSQQFEGLNVRFAPGHELVDLYLLAKCNYIMGPPSTYSLWASFIGNVPLYQVRDAKRVFSAQDFKMFQEQ
jgi:hypothetical protein